MRTLPANFLDCVQGSAEWFQARVGMVTSSRVSEAISMLKRKSNGKEPGAETAARAKYKLEMICERIKNETLNHYVSEWMELGKENEPLARAAYEVFRNVDVALVGLVLHPTIERAAASPDGLVGKDGLVEFKVPKITTHMEYLAYQRIPQEYLDQMAWQLACAGPDYRWNDFVSYCPELPAPFDLFIKRMERDDAAIAEMEQKVVRFLAEVDELEMQLAEHFGGESVIERKLKQSIAIARGAGPQLVVDALEIGPEDCA